MYVCGDAYRIFGIRITEQFVTLTFYCLRVGKVSSQANTQ